MLVLAAAIVAPFAAGAPADRIPITAASQSEADSLSNPTVPVWNDVPTETVPLSSAPSQVPNANDTSIERASRVNRPTRSRSSSPSAAGSRSGSSKPFGPERLQARASPSVTVPSCRIQDGRGAEKNEGAQQQNMNGYINATRSTASSSVSSPSRFSLNRPLTATRAYARVCSPSGFSSRYRVALRAGWPSRGRSPRLRSRR